MYCDPSSVVQRKEIFLRKIKQYCLPCLLKRNENKNIKGLHFDKVELKIHQYADDSTLLLKYFSILQEALKSVSVFSADTGHKLNIYKTEGLLLGLLRYINIQSFRSVKFSESPVRKKLSWNNNINIM